MISIDGIASMARMFLPADSPWLQRIEKAKELAGRFSPDRGGVSDLMRYMGKSGDDVRRAMSLLDNSRIAGMLNRVSPNLTETLRNAGNEILSSGQPDGSPLQPKQAQGPSEDFRKRLGRL